MFYLLDVFEHNVNYFFQSQHHLFSIIFYFVCFYCLFSFYMYESLYAKVHFVASDYCADISIIPPIIEYFKYILADLWMTGNTYCFSWTPICNLSLIINHVVQIYLILVGIVIWSDTDSHSVRCRFKSQQNITLWCYVFQMFFQMLVSSGFIKIKLSGTSTARDIVPHINFNHKSECKAVKLQRFCCFISTVI